MKHGLLLAAVVSAGLAAGPAGAEVERSVATTFTQLGIPLAHGGTVVVCHGFACAYRTPVVLTAADRVALAKLLRPGAASPQAERKAVAAAVAWFGRRIAPEAGTAGAKARAGRRDSGDPSQFDCIDSTSNTTNLMVMLDELGLLRHHVIDAPVSRGLFDGRPPHTTAVLREIASGRRWAVDSWTHRSGEAPDVLPLGQWQAAS